LLLSNLFYENINGDHEQINLLAIEQKIVFCSDADWISVKQNSFK